MPKEITTLVTFFGATGDLAKRKLFPSVYNLYKKGFLQEHFAILGTSRQEMTTEEFQTFVSDSIKEFMHEDADADFIRHFDYVKGDITVAADYAPLKAKIEKLDQEFALKGNRIFYMSIAPRFFGTVAQYLKSEELLSTDGEFNRLMIEKPFGVSFETAEKLQNELSDAFSEDQVYRIDHYLGKEMVQNIATLRFGNPIFNNAWNKDYIDNIQVTLSETLGVEDRAGYYDTAGALRDMIQNHTMQVVGWLAMDEPTEWTDTAIREAKNKAFNALKIYTPEEVAENFVRGQYGPDAANTQNGYLQEKDVPADSQNNTYVAGKLEFATDRWNGVPFYIRSGKRLAAKTTRIDVVFKQDANIFNSAQPLEKNVLSIIVDPEGKIEYSIIAKDTTPEFKTRPITLEWKVSAEDKAQTPEPYERMIHDTMDGNGSNFADWNGVAVAWKFVDAIQSAWDATHQEFPNYVSGSMGPVAADELLARDGHKWVYEG
ncbi:glucose-6-phosphate dehydrogenase [Periweissella ghanensis]|uniref:Glucose-6-phosphate 1-dehydrogenase n=1 Tax=Periweissella ghanensis TaxID=467997 RepID=A0ABN8BQ24_9LACO|nr:glucose-6-phosphate dehydrogenase [Periweissella ghanensis]MCM0601644.1 glucose-6-phosphate dehydrogenase [Periweissella ghanensis]CAH0418723.1 Glucose-6-phosphate 1-dehydrogenase [Periweissella ghanensis]